MRFFCLCALLAGGGGARNVARVTPLNLSRCQRWFDRSDLLAAQQNKPFMICAFARVIGCLLILLTVTLHAVAGAAEEFFDQGVKAFHSGDFEVAKESFERARDAGMDSSALYYNYGSTLYKLGRYAEAQAAFAVCARDPAWAALARYNMGLAAFQQGQRTEAAEYFDHAWRHTDDTKLAALAKTMLDRIDPMARGYPRGTFSFSLGYDSNVVLSDSTQSAPAAGKADVFSELLASTGARLGGGPGAPRWEAAIYDLRYSNLKDFSITQVLLGMHVPRRLGLWHSEMGGQGLYILRDGSAFQQAVVLKAGTTREWAGHRALRFDLRYDRIEALDNNFQFLDGQRLEFGATATQPAGAGWVYYGVTYEHHDRKDLSVGGEFFSYSPSRAAFWLKGSWPIAARWRLEPMVRSQFSRYADQDRRASGVVQTREDHEWQAGLLAKYRLTAAWQLTGEYIYSGSRSNFDEYSYTRHQIMIGVTRPL